MLHRSEEGSGPACFCNWHCNTMALPQMSLLHKAATPQHLGKACDGKYFRSPSCSASLSAECTLLFSERSVFLGQTCCLFPLCPSGRETDDPPENMQHAPAMTHLTSCLLYDGNMASHAGRPGHATATRYSPWACRGEARRTGELGPLEDLGALQGGYGSKGARSRAVVGAHQAQPSARVIHLRRDPGHHIAQVRRVLLARQQQTQQIHCCKLCTLCAAASPGITAASSVNQLLQALRVVRRVVLA